MASNGFGTNVSLKPPIAVPASLSANAVYDTGVFMIPGKSFVIGYLAAGATSYSLQRYLDAAKKLPIGAAITGTGTAATAAIAEVTDGKVALYCDFTITDTSGTTNAITAFTIIANESGS